MKLPNWNEIDIYFNNEIYIWEAAFINWFNWYESSADDWLLAAIIDNSCWQFAYNPEKIKPNTLTDELWNEIRDTSCRWLKIFIN